ncbi:MAG: VWA domain-containing protein [Nannocystaceae bacterium]|nr:VWA domain-containing protein [bacterium]
MRASLVARLSLLTATTVALPTLLACLDHPLKRVEYEAAQEEMEGIQIEVNKDVDILFVIDNSGSMGEEQANLSENFGNFVGVLEADDVKANYRLGITTTDDSNYWCTGNNVSAAESGQFVLSSCLGRENDFYFAGTDTNAFPEACEAFCSLTDADLEIQPTTTDVDPNPRARPWLENIEGATNLPEGVSTTEALQCFGPQGINGCGFESHLESMWKSLRLAQNAEQDQYGFLRDQAILSIVFVTDEADCSFNRDNQRTVFGEEGVGNQVFWSLPDVQQSPSSAVCWNAGVSCDFSLENDQCVSVNLDVNGNETENEDEMALYPLSKYTAFVQQLEDDKKSINPSQEVIVSAIAGVADNYDQTGFINYAEGPNANDENSFQANFGIGQGCTSQVAEAVPPVRLREFAETFLVNEDDTNLFSVCDTDYGPALDSIANSIRDQLKPACMPDCVADTDAVEPGLQPLCTLEQTSNDGSGNETVNIPVCGADDSVPEGADVCFVYLTDDERDQACVDSGYNLEFRIVRREGVPAPGGAQVSATCQLSQQRTVDCPNLPG